MWGEGEKKRSNYSQLINNHAKLPNKQPTTKQNSVHSPYNRVHHIIYHIYYSMPLHGF